MKNKNYLLVLIALFAICFGSLTTNAQQVFEYSYDQNGNRIKREVITLNPPRINKPILLDSIKTIVAYPNPVKDFLTIEQLGYDSVIMLDIEIYDFSGKKLYTQKTEQKNFNLDFSTFKNGSYIVRISSGSLRKEFKIIKQ